MFFFVAVYWLDVQLFARLNPVNNFPSLCPCHCCLQLHKALDIIIVNLPCPLFFSVKKDTALTRQIFSLFPAETNLLVCNGNELWNLFLTPLINGEETDLSYIHDFSPILSDCWLKIPRRICGIHVNSSLGPATILLRIKCLHVLPIISNLKVRAAKSVLRSLARKYTYSNVWLIFIIYL